jgi:hypothetical protein
VLLGLYLQQSTSLLLQSQLRQGQHQQLLPQWWLQQPSSNNNSRCSSRLWLPKLRQLWSGWTLKPWHLLVLVLLLLLLLRHQLQQCPQRLVNGYLQADQTGAYQLAG